MEASNLLIKFHQHFIFSSPGFSLPRGPGESNEWTVPPRDGDHHLLQHQVHLQVPRRVPPPTGGALYVASGLRTLVLLNFDPDPSFHFNGILKVKKSSSLASLQLIHIFHYSSQQEKYFWTE